MKLLEISFGNWNNILHGSCVTTFIIRDFAKQSQLRITAHILLYALSVLIKGAQNKMQSHSLSFSHSWLKILQMETYFITFTVSIDTLHFV